MLRRSRGYAPHSLPCRCRCARCWRAARSSRAPSAWPRARAPGWGTTSATCGNWETLRSFREGIAHFEALFAVEPEVVAHDLHPDYLSTGYALQREGVELVGVQHHHAHLAACLAEHGERGPAIGAIYDGSGLGTDGTIWGGELLVGDLESVQRAGHLQPVRLPGGDAAAREPWRMACAWLHGALDGEATLAGEHGWAGRPGRWEQVGQLVRTGTASPITTSVGRLFDAVAALCGIRMTVREEGRAAMELEAAAAGAAALSGQGAYPLPVVAGELVRLDAHETVRAIVDDLAAGVSAALVSARFHNGLADATPVP